MKKTVAIIVFLLCFILIFSGCGKPDVKKNESVVTALSDISEFNGEPFAVINNNEPQFETDDLVAESYEKYSELDSLGRCGIAMASVGVDIMPTEERGSIGQVKPTGWHTVKYDSVDGKYLYNRCHLIGFQLTGENANVNNLITGTRYFNVEGMLPFENMIADYVKETENHVIYRVTPIFKGENLVASGVQLEAKSVEDKGDGVCFNVYVYNNQPGIEINYLTGESKQISEETTVGSYTYILNTSSKKLHRLDCGLANDIKEHNKKYTSETKESLIKKGYSPCKGCNP